jgi:methionyl-tRNA synthetase
MARKIFVTTALPYANGPFHIGHIMEYIQADIWVRFQRMQGNEVHSSVPMTRMARPSCSRPQADGITPQAAGPAHRRRAAGSTCMASH